MSDAPNCPTGAGDNVPEHEFEHPAKRRVVLVHADNPGPVRRGVRRALGPRVRRVAYPCAVPGISLTDYSRLPSGKGWGPACTGSRTTITLSNGVRLTVRSEIAELVALIMNANIRQGYSYRQADTGGYNCRFISGTTVWSNHAWALAVDENWQTNPYASPLRTDRPAWEQQRWQRYGFALGINYRGRQDAMHNEFMGTPDQARQATDLARRELGGQQPVSTATRAPTRLPAVKRGVDNGGWDYLCQGALQEAGYYTGDVDGDIGPQTEAAILAVQKRFAFGRQDGVCTGWTWVAFLAMRDQLASETSTAMEGSVALEVLQNMLGYTGAGLDRSWGPGVTTRVMEVQRGAGLTADGVVGADTRAVLALASE